LLKKYSLVAPMASAVNRFHELLTWSSVKQKKMLQFGTIFKNPGDSQLSVSFLATGEQIFGNNVGNVTLYILILIAQWTDISSKPTGLEILM
jgi:hypothetical protein